MKQFRNEGMIRLQVIIFAAVMAMLAAFPTLGAEWPQHNFLFIVDSSISMTRHKSAAIKLVRDVIASRFDGQVEEGDSIDIWTYDTENNLRGFPPQIWGRADAERIADTASQYLEKYTFKGRSDFSNVAADLSLFVPQTKNLLIVIITDGEKPFAGISLDLEINGYLAGKKKLGQATTEPLLVSIAAINGALRTWTAYFGEGKVDLATLPLRKKPELVAAEVKEQKKPAPIVKAPSRKPAARAPIASTPWQSEAPTAFNYPPGTRITPVNSAPSANAANPADKPLKVAVAEMLARSRATAQAKRAEMDSRAEVARNTLAAAPVRAPAVKNLPAAQKTNIPDEAKSTSAPVTNLAKQAMESAKTTNKTVLTATTNQTNTANIGVAAAATKPPTPPRTDEANAPAKRKSVATDLGSSTTGFSPHLTLQGVIYISGLTGVACMAAGIFLLYRKLKRPSESIISRSLLQR